MKRVAPDMTRSLMARATDRARARTSRLIEDARNLAEDTSRQQRLDAQKCSSCFYIAQIGGAAMTSQACMCCHQDQLHASTNTDVLCLSCAHELQLCRHCGGDLEMNVDRADWPTPKNPKIQEAIP